MLCFLMVCSVVFLWVSVVFLSRCDLCLCLWWVCCWNGILILNISLVFLMLLLNCIVFMFRVMLGKWL